MSAQELAQELTTIAIETLGVLDWSESDRDELERRFRDQLASADDLACEILEIVRAAGIHEGDTAQERVRRLVAERDELKRKFRQDGAALERGLRAFWCAISVSERLEIGQPMLALVRHMQELP